MGKFVPASEMSLSDQVQIRREKLAQLQAEGMDPFVQTKFEFDSCSTEIKDHFEAMEGKTVSLAGRIVSKRGMGKVMFCDLKDYAGRIQLYVRMDEMETPEAYDRFKKMDIGDIVGVKGDVFRTQKGEILSGSTRRPCSARPCCPCRRSFTASPIWRPATASAMWT